MKTRMGKPTWEFWKKERDQDFIEWFEQEVFGQTLAPDSLHAEELDKLNMVKN